jgi:hypothetical protein
MMPIARVREMIWAAVLGLSSYAGAAPDMVVESFDALQLPPTLHVENLRAERVTDSGDGGALELRGLGGKAGSAVLTPPKEGWDWSPCAGVSIEYANPGKDPLTVGIRLDSRGADEKLLRIQRTLTLPAGFDRAVPLFFTNGNAGPYWGMRGIPLYGPLTKTGFELTSANVNSARITRVEIILDNSARDICLRLDNITAFDADSPLARLVPHPFIDRFGQYLHEDWPGKIHHEEEFREAREREEAALDAAPALAGRDEYGGWAGGPQLEATGWFRTEQVDGRWWLVTPAGHLFFSLGMDCIPHGDSTFIDARPDWFEWTPQSGEPLSEFLGSVSGVHSMAETIEGKGRCLNFHNANLKRKFGDTWEAQSRELAYRRLRAWGFNTLGAWTRGDITAQSPLPYVVQGGSAHTRALEGNTGYWGKLLDVFDPDFAPKTDQAIAAQTAAHRGNPMVLGYFIDNEMSWTGIARSTLASPPAQPARQVFVEQLKAKYGSLEALNAAWEANAADWDDLRLPATPKGTCRGDIDAFEYQFGRKYFETVAGALHTHAPHQLYLGCRFTLVYCPEAVLRACAELADVVSINAYLPQMDPTRFTELGKPVIIGEFHFGALDRGLFHTGLQPADNQADRASKYVRYVESVAANPTFVGCHWFQYVDQPATGRTLDGENYAIGMVSVADVPHAELVEAARALHQRLYSERGARH